MKNKVLSIINEEIKLFETEVDPHALLRLQQRLDLMSNNGDITPKENDTIRKNLNNIVTYEKFIPNKIEGLNEFYFIALFQKNDRLFHAGLSAHFPPSKHHFGRQVDNVHLDRSHFVKFLHRLGNILFVCLVRDFKSVNTKIFRLDTRLFRDSWFFYD